VSIKAAKSVGVEDASRSVRGAGLAHRTSTLEQSHPSGQPTPGNSTESCESGSGQAGEAVFFVGESGPEGVSEGEVLTGASFAAGGASVLQQQHEPVPEQQQPFCFSPESPFGSAVVLQEVRSHSPTPHRQPAHATRGKSRLTITTNVMARLSQASRFRRRGKNMQIHCSR